MYFHCCILPWIASIRQCFSSFAVSTLHALDELHGIGYAHLDVRTPNICFKQVDHEWQAVLIDIDTAVHIKGPIPPGNKDFLMYDILFEDDEGVVALATVEL